MGVITLLFVRTRDSNCWRRYRAGDCNRVNIHFTLNNALHTVGLCPSGVEIVSRINEVSGRTPMVRGTLYYRL